MGTVRGRSPQELVVSGELRRFIAVHEAGHAALGAVLGLEVVEVSCIPQPWGEGQLGGGGTRFVTLDGAQETLVADHPDAAGLVLLAGSFAEQSLLGGQFVDGGFSGDLEIWKRGMMRAGRDHTSRKQASELVAATQRHVATNLEAIRTIAQAVEEAGQLTGAEVSALLASSR
jgi:hypothetical protein